MLDLLFRWPWLLPVLPLLFGVLFIGLRTWLHSPLRMARRRGREIEQLRRAAGEVALIAQAPEGLCRIRGRVRVLEGARGYPALGAYLTWSSGTVKTDQLDEHNQPVMHATFKTSSGCGRFAVEDESGLVIVDSPDKLEIWDDGSQVGMFGSGAIEVRDGDEVELLGFARDVTFPAEVASLLERNYRGGHARGLKLESSPRQALWVVVTTR